MKSPLYPTPSGDRRIARLFIRALEFAGYTVEIATHFRSLDINGHLERQNRLQKIGKKLAQRLIRRYQSQPPSQRPNCWFTYHIYHKAPDWIGPTVSQALDIPYVIAEGSYSPKQMHGPWQIGLNASKTALQLADKVICINPADLPCLHQLVPASRIIQIKPFLEPETFSRPTSTKQEISERWPIDARATWLICVAMMRPGDKSESYRILAEAMKHIHSDEFQLLIVGHGTNAEQVHGYFSAIRNVHFLGQQDSVAIHSLLSASDLFVWPAVNEALGMVLLEAQAAGTALIAGREGGVSSVVSQNSALLVEPRNSLALTNAIDSLLGSPKKLSLMGAAGRDYVLKNHSLANVASLLDQSLRELLV